jgi:O-antigen/teichoic acid export membrane protein
MQASPSKRVVRNFGVVLRGRGIAGVLNLAATALMAHALQATEFGLVILLHTYVLAVRGILNFRTFEAIVKFGVPLHEKGDNGGLKTLFRQTMAIDAASAILATGVGVFAAPLAGHFLHWDARMSSLAGLYSLIMLTTVINTPNGILRLYDRFDALSVFYTVGPRPSTGRPTSTCCPSTFPCCWPARCSDRPRPVFSAWRVISPPY